VFREFVEALKRREWGEVERLRERLKEIRNGKSKRGDEAVKEQSKQKKGRNS
jgi:hypothetical protein